MASTEEQQKTETMASPGSGAAPMEGPPTSSPKGMDRSMAMDQLSGSMNTSGDYGKSLPSPHQQPPGGRPPHPPYNKQHGSYSAVGGGCRYAGYPLATGPPRQLHSVVTSSFSAEDSGDHAHHRGGHPPVPRHVNVNTVHQQHWDGPPNNDRYARERRVDNQEVCPDGREQPPREDPPAMPIVPPSPSRGNASQGGFFSQRGSGGPSGMVPPEPLKRNFWHHSRPNEETSSSLPPEFMPPKRTKLAPPPINTRPVRSPSGGDMRDLRRPPSFFNRALSWESRDDSSYYPGTPRGPPPPRESPRYHSEQGHSYPAMGSPLHSYQQYHHPSPTAQYRVDERGHHPHHHHQYPPPPQEIAYHQHHSSPSHGAAAAAANHQHNRRWSNSDVWQPPMGSPTSGPRRSPTSYHQPHYSAQQFRDDVESDRGWTPPMERESIPGYPDDSRRMNHYDSRRDHEAAYHHNSQHYNPYGHYKKPASHQGSPPLTSPHISGMVSMDQRNPASGSRSNTMNDSPRVGLINEDKPKAGKDGSLLLLALPQDRISLSETLCVVRENIEVFRATKSDVEAPAPGRKHAVVVNQVGLRCIHCRHTTKSSDRVKRAVCYPSSIKRIYRTVIDMKLDHFLQCQFVPEALKERLAELKVKHTRSTGTTMQYFIRGAHALGMEDGPSGVRLNDSNKHSLADLPPLSNTERSKVQTTASFSSNNPTISVEDNMGPEAPSSSEQYRSIDRMNSLSSENTNITNTTPDTTANETDTFYNGKINLALAEDKMALSPLRCFLRSQVCAFSATPEDIAVRAPTTFSISVGQVGIGCIHCVNQPSKLRSNRAVCFPFSIARIYQSVADIQRFHFGECKMLPPDVKEKFLSLQRASSKGSKGLATRQYWVTSARKLGLVDTHKGIRFGRDPSRPEQAAMSLDILAQVAFNVTTASRELVLPEDEPYIAEFLYVVMEQLQPCRFTEADRNKRRLKDVGCIGVECKHCAGQVDGRKFFWSSVNAVESNFVSVHTHMMECRQVPNELKEKLADLKKLRKEQTAALKTGSQKAFFSRVWSRLHGDEQRKRQQEAQGSQPKPQEVPSKEPQKEEEDAKTPAQSPQSEPMETESSPQPQPLSLDSPSSSRGCPPSPMGSEGADTESEPENAVVEGVSTKMCQMSVVGV